MNSQILTRTAPEERESHLMWRGYSLCGVSMFFVAYVSLMWCEFPVCGVSIWRVVCVYPCGVSIPCVTSVSVGGARDPAGGLQNSTFSYDCVEATILATND